MKLTKDQYKFTFNMLQEVIFSGKRKPGIEIREGIIWYVFDYFAFSEKNIKEEDRLFNSSMFMPVKFAEHFASGLNDAVPLKDENVLKVIKDVGKKVIVHKFTSSDGKERWVNEEAVKLLPPTIYEYRGSAKGNETYCVKDDELRGFILNYRMREEN